MTRHFSNIRDDIRTLEENINSIAEKTLQVLEQKNILKLNEELCEESIEKAKNEEFSRKEAYMRALRKLMVNIPLNLSYFYFFNRNSGNSEFYRL